MKKLALIIVLACTFIACEECPERYTQSSAEIDTFKEVIAAYEAADWENYTAKFADTAKVYHNTDDKSMTPAETVEAHKTTTSGLSSYGFVSDKGDVEMVTTDKGETWVNYWGLWKGTIASTGTEMMIPVHVTAQFVDGKVVEEYGYWDTAALVAALTAAASEDASEEGMEQAAEEGAEESEQ
ncbi:nuclear transport factor 2 family protein [Aureitalea sp. L0-47]|uniref:nuclear transport factor 2 family protein n=1 Tax=Aureitalea sp. L0-47 TaxID=2816962 RepID=UPI002237A796|nr:nuclear transport factor 2 family protein [Aureitalea sp. L0-47]MCW5520961.1 nuclear transport factor 2 family protein [Aureitalea sp. L0-47]